MNIKRSTYLIRSIFYLQEVVRCKSISRAAEENNLKASNLSLMIKNLESQLGVTLLTRSPLGCEPTEIGLKIAQVAEEIREKLQKITKLKGDKQFLPQKLKVFVAENLSADLKNEFERLDPYITLNFVKESDEADIKINNQKPINAKEPYTELTIGTEIKQTIWISCQESNSAAMTFFDFIITKLLL